METDISTLDNKMAEDGQAIRIAPDALTQILTSDEVYRPLLLPSAWSGKLHGMLFPMMQYGKHQRES